MQQLKSGFKRTINWNTCHSKTEPLNAPNPDLDFLIDSSFQGVNRIFVLPVNANDNRIGHSGYYPPTAKVKDCKVMIDGRKIFFDQPIKNYIKIYDGIRKITTGQGDNYATGCLLNYKYLKKHYKMIAKDLSKQQALDAESRAIQQINFTGNISGNNNRVIFFIIEEAKETVLDFLQGTVIVNVVVQLSYCVFHNYVLF